MRRNKNLHCRGWLCNIQFFYFCAGAFHQASILYSLQQFLKSVAAYTGVLQGWIAVGLEVGANR